MTESPDIEQIAEKAQRVAGDALQRALPSLEYRAAAEEQYPGDERLLEIAFAAEFMLRHAASNLQRGKKFIECLCSGERE